MDFALSADQRLMQASVAGVLGRASPLARVRAFAEGGEPVARDVWTALTELGLPGLLVAEEHGGLGLGLLDAALAAEILGAHVAPAPFLGSAVLAPLALAAAGSPTQKSAWLPRLAGGEIVAGAILHEALAGARDAPGVTVKGGRLTGGSMFALDASGADILLVADRSGGFGPNHLPCSRRGRRRAAGGTSQPGRPSLPGVSAKVTVRMVQRRERLKVLVR